MASGFDGLNPVFAQRLQQMIQAAAAEGKHIGIGSGLRSTEEQIALRKKNGCPDVWTSPASSCRVPTAIPGRSNHNHGLAADITGDKGWANANAARFGLHFPVRGEDWHVELIDDDDAKKAVGGAVEKGAIGFDMNWMEEQRNPEDELVSRLDSVMSILTGQAPTAEEASNPAELAGLRTDVTMIPGGEPSSRQTQVGGGGVPQGGKYDPKGGVEQWRGLAIEALKYVGEDPGLVDVMLRRMNQESGGNPTIQNNWDSNAKKGTPSIGLMQTIAPTFQAHAGELAGRGITDPFANMVASLRYAKSRYGDVAKAYNRRGGY